MVGYAVVSLIRGRSQSIDLETVAHEVRSKINPPVQIDEDTRLDDIRTVSNTELGYFLTLVKVTKSQFDANPIGMQFESKLSRHVPKSRLLAVFQIGIHRENHRSNARPSRGTRAVLTGKDCGR